MIITNTLLILTIILQVLILVRNVLKEREEDDLSLAYAFLIMRGKKTLDQVPVRLKEQVKQDLIDLDCEYLIEE